jgi:hypothetical protein
VPVWAGAENLAVTGIRSPGRPALSESLYRLSIPAPDIELICLVIVVSNEKYTVLILNFSSRQDESPGSFFDRSDRKLLLMYVFFYMPMHGCT